MSRHYWHLLRGYREADIIAAHVDGLLSYASYMAGVKEVILAEPMRIYHIDHDDKFTDRIERDKLPLERWLSFNFIPTWLNNRIIVIYRKFLLLMGYRIKRVVHGVPTLSYTEYQKMCRDILTSKRSYIFNDENWGLGKEKLPETMICRAEWEQ
ncbi:MAG: hypothetical protein HY529_00870, partial [Chloroflexi bacterium]|nr:hypothetical protein [Chloroflexota bacterium]